MYPSNIVELHIELTDKCQASCPMCARNFNGGAPRPFVGNHDITLEQFKEWFPVSWLRNLVNFYACGNYGDPIIARDCLEIFQYVRETNPTVRLAIHTNGSARSISWWQRLAEVLGPNHSVVFGIDGFEDTHSLYRKGTSWSKIIENATAFIQAGGNASVDSLVFQHNQDTVDQFEQFLLNLGFKEVNFKSTSRFYDMGGFPVNDNNGVVEYVLYPATSPRFKITPQIQLEKVAKDITIWLTKVEQTEISPRCKNRSEIYVDPRRNILPCCYIGSEWIDEPLNSPLAIHQLRDKLILNTKRKFAEVTIPNLVGSNIEKVLSPDVWKDLDTLWHGADKAWSCVKNCGK